MNVTKKLQINPLFVWLAIALIGATGMVHLIEAPGNYSEMAYKGILFYANFAASAVAAFGIFRQQRWGWWLGVLVAIGSLVMYVVSRTIGLPGLPAADESWFETIGVVSMLVEAGFLVVAGGALLGQAEVKQIPAKSH